MRAMPVVLLILVAGFCPAVHGQAAPVSFPTISTDHFLAAAGTFPGPPRLAQLEEKKEHTVTGFLIGAVLGMAAGWAFYNAMCEAVDNNCSDSRVRLVILGGAAGGALGALIGSLSE